LGFCRGVTIHILLMEEQELSDKNGHSMRSWRKTDLAHHPPKKSRTYFVAVKMMTPASIHFIALAGMYFWHRAPRYMPAIPPTPNRMPSSQSGATDMSG
jgi:hypothetical protein